MAQIDENLEVVITVTEETAINIRVKPDSVLTKDYVSILVEPWECQRANNSAWIRESLLFDIENITDRCNAADQIIEMYNIVAKDPEIVQLTLKNRTLTIRNKNQVNDITDIPYDDIDTDVEHIAKHREFFRTTGIVGITEQDGEYDSFNLINRECTLIYVGYSPDDDYVVDNPDLLKQEKVFATTAHEVSSLLDDKEKIPPLVLIVNPDYAEVGCTVLDKYFDPIDCVVCDTWKMDDRLACMFLSIAKRRGVIMVRSASVCGIYNFGNGLATGNEDSKIGLICMDDDIITDDYNYMVKVDSRMAMIRDLVVILNKRKNVEMIILKHSINDHDLRDLDNYKVFPAFQTKQFSQIDQLSHGHVLHTPMAVMTPIPGIASLLVSCGIFASCRAVTVMEYVEKVLDALKFEPKIQEIEDDDSDSDDDESPQKDIADVIADKLEKVTIKESKQKIIDQLNKN
jgi:hypothetical protein